MLRCSVFWRIDGVNFNIRPITLPVLFRCKTLIHFRSVLDFALLEWENQESWHGWYCKTILQSCADDFFHVVHEPIVIWWCSTTAKMEGCSSSFALGNKNNYTIPTVVQLRHSINMTDELIKSTNSTCVKLQVQVFSPSNQTEFQTLSSPLRTYCQYCNNLYNS